MNILNGNARYPDSSHDSIWEHCNVGYAKPTYTGLYLLGTFF